MTVSLQDKGMCIVFGHATCYTCRNPFELFFHPFALVNLHVILDNITFKISLHFNVNEQNEKSFKVPADEYFYSILHSHMHCSFNFFYSFCLQAMKPFGSGWIMIPIVLLILISAGHADNTAMNPEDLAQKMADQLNGKI